MLCQVAGIVILNSDGERIAVRYFSDGIGPNSFQDFAAQTRFEQQLFSKSNRLSAGRTEVEIVMVDDAVALFRSINDICVFVVGDPQENELVLLEVINTIVLVLGNITK
eukprot:GHVT01009273.1.p4 GENE.GHVT01009273.1~~GHVT01009273.1.p4  ORF type:complete len:109 (+),score=5.53 GHVT01009273.1:1567-1893(+)